MNVVSQVSVLPRPSTRFIIDITCTVLSSFNHGASSEHYKINISLVETIYSRSYVFLFSIKTASYFEDSFVGRNQDKNWKAKAGGDAVVNVDSTNNFVIESRSEIAKTDTLKALGRHRPISISVNQWRITLRPSSDKIASSRPIESCNATIIREIMQLI